MRKVIAGICAFDAMEPIKKSLLKKMCEAMRYQPAADEAVWVDQEIGFAVLSFREPNGAQPLHNFKGTIWMAADADIVNQDALRQSLIPNDKLIIDQNKSALLPMLYERQGIKFLKNLNGFFALAIWDGRTKELLLARDRFGSRPLFYSVVRDRLIFASDIKALLTLNIMTPGLDIEAFVEYFTFQTNLGDRTWFKNIRLLPPGHVLRLHDGNILKESYWDLIYQEDEDLGENSYRDRLRDQLDQTMKRQASAQRAMVGSFLSGGLDTGTIIAFASRHVRLLPTFHCGYDMTNVIPEELKFSETEQARKLSRLLGTEYHEIILNPGHLKHVLPRVVWHLESPRINISYPNFLVGQIASRKVDIILTGTGGDEFFGSYPWRYSRIIDCTERTKFEALYYQLRARLIQEDQWTDAFSDSILGTVNGCSAFENFREVLKPVQANDPLHWAMYFDVKTAVHDLLMVDTQLDAAHGLACRSPLLDNDLVSFVLRIPARYKFNKIDFKYILKKSLKGILPDEILQRPKIGFIPPDGSWYRGPLREYVHDVVLGARALERNYFKESYLRRIVVEHMDGKANHRALLWSLMCFEWWNRLFIDKEPLS